MKYVEIDPSSVHNEAAVSFSMRNKALSPQKMVASISMKQRTQDSGGFLQPSRRRRGGRRQISVYLSERGPGSDLV